MNKKQYTVIVAEDEELLLNNLIQKIENTNLGFLTIGKAQTGTQAYALTKDLSPDLLITDIKMPLMDGITLLEKVHILDPNVKFIITSGFSDFTYAQKAIRLQVVEYLLKPIDPEALYHALIKVKTQLEDVQSYYTEIFDTTMSRCAPEQIASALQEYIASNYMSEINLHHISENLNYSSGYLTKIFYQYYNITPGRYIIMLRMCEAKKLLLSNPDLTIKQIGDIVGYQDQSYFSRIFKKQVGISPFEYREKNALSNA